MNPTKWSDVTVFQWQQLTDLFTSGKEELKTPMCAILTGKTENEIDSLAYMDRENLVKQFAFVHEPPKGEPQKFIQVQGRRYKCLYDIRKLPGARYIESKHFAQDPNGNLHRIAASMILPMKKTLFGWRDDNYDAGKHQQYADDMLLAPITAVLGSVVFFCEVYRGSIKSLRGYLIKEMEKRMTTHEAQEMLQTLEEFLDGTIALSLSPLTNA